MVTRESQRTRGDAYPEEAKYVDDGCSVSPTCLRCPLPQCRYDTPGGVRVIVNRGRDCAMRSLSAKGLPVDRIAAGFGVSRRTVFRALKREGCR